LETTGYSDFASPSSTTASLKLLILLNTTGYERSYTYQPDYDGGGGSPDYSDTGTYDEAALSQPSTITGPTDPGVAGTYVDGKFVPSQDTITRNTQDIFKTYKQNMLLILYHFYYHLWVNSNKGSRSNSCR
jgi:hypothetical protein